MKTNKVQLAIATLRNEILRAIPYREYLTEIETEGHTSRFSARYFGNWQNPVDAEDEEDYDWQEPTAATVKRLDEICKRFSKQYKVVVTWQSEGEKNWIGFAVTKRTRKTTQVAKVLRGVSGGLRADQLFAMVGRDLQISRKAFDKMIAGLVDQNKVHQSADVLVWIGR